MLEHQVVGTIPVGRHVLLIADVPVGAGAELAGRRVDDVHDGSDVRLIALRRRGGAGGGWAPRPDDQLPPPGRLGGPGPWGGAGRVLACRRSRWPPSRP